MEVENSSVVVVNTVPQPVPIEQDNSNLNRDDFPPDFLFGSGTSAYQVEGAAAIGGKGPSIWDDFTLRTPNRVGDGTNGNVAADMYHRYKEDIKLMKKMGFNAYRFSISWSRVLPGGRTSAGINKEGLDYYNDLIDTVIAHGMQPFVTIFHWDLPHCLQLEYDGFLSKKIVSDFREYAELLFWEFGDRVKLWSTLNEAYTYCVNGYVRGSFPPSKVTSPPERVLKKLCAHRNIQLDSHTVPITHNYSDVKFDKSDPAKDVYTAARNMLICHAVTVDLYRKKFKKFQHGQIGITNVCNYFIPYDENSPDDIAAARRATDFMLGWFLEPVLYGHYPQNMIDNVPPENLASFTHPESQMLKDSVDFVGQNYYTSTYIANDPNPQGVGYDADQKILFHTDRDGVPIGGSSAASWLFVVPWGLRDLLVQMKDLYPGIPPIYITENGFPDKTDFKLTAKEACADTTRTKFHQDHLAYLLKAINQDNVDVKGYFAWSYCDTFEWSGGFDVRMGLIYIDFMNNLTRIQKHSALWFSAFLTSRKQLLSSKKQNEDNDANVGQKRLRTA